jgi:BASS family bile acid:Na+ symporter
MADGPLGELLNNFVDLTILSIMFGMGLRLDIEKATYLLRDPQRLLRSLLVVDLLLPVVAILMITLLPLPLDARVGLGLMAACPGAPLLTRRVEKAFGSFDYSASLQLTACILAVITVPVTLEIFSTFVPVDIFPAPQVIGRQVVEVQLIPIAIGLLIRQFFVELADQITQPVIKLANVLFMVLVILALTQVFNVFKQLSPLIVIAIVMILVVGLSLGHILGGPALETRTTLAISAIARNAGLAIYLALTYFPELRLLSVILGYIILAFLAEATYKALLKRQKLPEST